MGELIYGIAGRIFQISRPVRDALYRRWIKEHPCCACGKWWHIDPAHTGPHSSGKKGSDWKVIPLCHSCHRLFDASPFKFAAKHQLDIQKLIQMYQELYAITYPKRIQVGVGTGEAVGRGEAVVAGEDLKR